ncbi:bifunctional diguanylate cyclase/phosphodiesterase [Rhizobium sp. SSA_523]|uniref:putative bifunctional diguanylate cyclase/phosphodiesterase n=1 Tax=Rhizobium sp. SSA_523 TaxID=2952477 RepID=UPI0020907137|nr:EAL domain-containing protein [Rhizobium sp. SSA_523]MCO5731319.1 EAL domain-containing protein [Rhizobium sp. SSA_523]WKC22148.1 EAL domain-containing protein [Rhizobium sp. SSA_523]
MNMNSPDRNPVPPKPLTTAAPEEILDALPHPILIVDTDGHVIFTNKAGRTILQAAIGIEFSELFPGSRAPSGESEFSGQRILSDAGEPFRAAAVYLANGDLLVDLRPIADDPDPVLPKGVDDLTGLATRPTLLAHLSAALEGGSNPSSIAIHCLDLDRFKMVNDTLGHAVGDILLTKVADRIRSACRKGDLVARLGGDEFVVLQQDVEGAAAAEKLAARLVELVGRTYIINGHTINIGVSLGVAFSNGLMQARDLLRNGDLALYEAKRAGRGRYRVFEPGMDTLLLERRQMEIDLRRALALKQFKLNYQPFFDVTTNRMEGFEALLRWEHPVKGNVPPLSFISLAEENGLIVKIGEWVLRTACQEAASWPGDMVVAVNVSPLQFKADNLLETVSEALRRSGLPAQRLELEITEGALLDETETVIQTLNCLRELGVRISMDDFGTGYSSLSYLQKFPFNKIKIDRSFVASNDSDSEAILRSIATLGTSLGMAITAEGVETAEQLERVRGERCTHVQGYLTGRPMPADHISAFLAEAQQEQ